jgi:hypothetical protein
MHRFVAEKHSFPTPLTAMRKSISEPPELSWNDSRQRTFPKQRLFTARALVQVEATLNATVKVAEKPLEL